MALADVLRERASRQGRTAQVDCGALGVLTVEALPLRECAALAKGPDGDRAVFYAACRELQAAGEELRQAGQVFAPDGVMQYVSDREAALAARMVLALSGVEPAADKPAADKPAADKPEPDKPKPDEPEPLEQEDGADDPGGGEGLTSMPQEAAEPDASIRADVPAAANGTADGRPGQAEENRLEAVQDIEKQFFEIRPGTVQKQTPEMELRPAVRRKPKKDLKEIRRETVQKQTPREMAPVTEAERNDQAPERGGQVSREFADNLDKNDEAWKPDKKTQSLVEKPGKGLQNVAEKTGRTTRETVPAPAERPGTETGSCENLPEFEAPLHETMSESGGGPKTGMHEATSEFDGGAEPELHEITSEFDRTGVSKLHEIKLEIPKTMHEVKSEYAGDLHETTSESDGGACQDVHENKSDVPETVHEMTSESAERMARLLLEGLRRAYMVR